MMPEDGKKSFIGKLFSSKPKRFPDYFKYIELTLVVLLRKDLMSY